MPARDAKSDNVRRRLARVARKNSVFPSYCFIRKTSPKPNRCLTFCFCSYYIASGRPDYDGFERIDVFYDAADNRLLEAETVVTEKTGFHLSLQQFSAVRFSSAIPFLNKTLRQ
jgi:hypothetical protein